MQEKKRGLVRNRSTILRAQIVRLTGSSEVKIEWTIASEKTIVKEIAKLGLMERTVKAHQTETETKIAALHMTIAAITRTLASFTRG
jgi:hypothetical protein